MWKKIVRKGISDDVNSMLQEEVVYVCPLRLSDDCERFESLAKPFTNHHINGDSSVSEYWNLIKICEPCHKEIETKHRNNDAIQRRIKLKKRNLALQYFSPIAINVLRLAYKHGATSAMPAMALKLLEKGYLKVLNKNTFTVGMAKHVTLQDYEITDRGRELIDKLIGETPLGDDLFSL